MTKASLLSNIYHSLKRNVIKDIINVKFYKIDDDSALKITVNNEGKRTDFILKESEIIEDDSEYN